MLKLIDDFSQPLFSGHWRWQAEDEREQPADGLGVRFQIRAGFAESHEDFKRVLWLSVRSN